MGRRSLTGLLPSREDDYRITPEMVRSAELFSFVFGDLAQRLKQREALEATFEALIEEGTTAALTQIATNVAPQLAELQDDILAAQAEIEAILGTGEISPFVKVNILPAQDDAAILAALGIPALFNALRSEIMGGAPAAALDTIYELAERLAEDGDAIAAINTAIAAKLNASAVSAWVLGNLLAAGDKAAARAVLGIVMDDADKTKLNGIAAGANATPALSDAAVVSGTAGVPSAPTAAQLRLAAQTHASSAVKAWVNFNGVTSAIRGALNVSSITDFGNGDAGINFTTPMPDENYGIAASCCGFGPTNTNNFPSIKHSGNGPQAGDPYTTITSVRVISGDGTTLRDSVIFCVTIMR